MLSFSIPTLCIRYTLTPLYYKMSMVSLKWLQQKQNCFKTNVYSLPEIQIYLIFLAYVLTDFNKSDGRFERMRFWWFQNTPYFTFLMQNCVRNANYLKTIFQKYKCSLSDVKNWVFLFRLAKVKDPFFGWLKLAGP